MISAEQEELNRLNEQLEAVTRTAEENKADAVQWMSKYKALSERDATLEAKAAHYLATTNQLQGRLLKLEDRVDALLNIIVNLSARDSYVD